MNRFYAALRPANLRVIDGPPVVVRGRQTTLAFELVNTSDTMLDPSAGIGQATVPLGAFQSWIEPLTPSTSLEGCAPQLARRGAQVAAGSRLLTVASMGGGEPFGAHAGMTVRTGLASPLFACMPTGRFRLTIEYVRLGATDGAPIGTTTLDLQLIDPARWAATLNMGRAATVTASVVGAEAGRVLTESIVVQGMRSGGWAWIAIRAGACDPTGAPLLPPATLLASGAATDRLAHSGTLTPAARQALSRAHTLSLWVTIDQATACGLLVPVPSATQRDAPTTWAGGHLRATEATTGLRVSGSSETVLGNVAQAVDGQPNTTWNSGGWTPGWIEIDLGRNLRVTGVRLLPAQLPTTATTLHRVYGRVDGSRAEVMLAELHGVTVDNVWTEVAFPTAKTVRYLRIETVQTPSWVAWREISILGASVPKPSALPIGTHDITGGVAGTGQCVAAGWAVDPDDLARDVAVRFLIDGKLVWSGVADAPRPDVLAAGFGHGSNGFHIPIDRLLSKGDVHEVRVQARDEETGRWVDLTSTPKTLTCV